MNTLLLTLLIIAVIVLYPFYAHIVEIFRATAWANILERKFKTIINKTKSEENGKIE